MPTVSVGRDRLFEALGRTYSQEEFEDLCFKFGIELDDVTTERAIMRKEKHLEEEATEDEEVIYKIEVAANRRRTLVAIGSHDLDTIEGPFTYESDLKLKKFLHIVENSPVYPVLYDRNRTVLSLPPIINGAHSAITLKTKNVFIECTATDLTKAKIVLNTMVTMFSVYCQSKFEVEPVEVVYSDGKSSIYPDLSLYHMEVPLSYITDIVGVPLDENEVASLLNKMQLHAKKSVCGECTFTVSVPPTRSDVLHPCDVAEDVAIAYGYNEIPKSIPPSLKPLPLNQFSDLIRSEIAMSGFTEVLTWVLCSYKENFSMLNREDNKSTAVIIGNPRSADFEVVRASLMPGILKTVGHNKDHPKPIKIFEVGDITLLDEKKDVGASNRRRLAALYCGANSGFELIHGLVDRVMEIIGTPFVQPGDNAGYYIERANEPEFLPGRQASIIYKGKCIGAFGIVHPEGSLKQLLILQHDSTASTGYRSKSVAFVMRPVEDPNPMLRLLMVILKWKGSVIGFVEFAYTSLNG
ncbi:tRNA synthetase beta subunit family protein [Actinidia rufa]|uniref:phenylalanine--tRNA ligase n=1 Tax=Actinidia rufa TaxID=165716 RepID=A0A7J0GN33_9ERIC|nr:tRNA synthetase beta subunit family protein [Actinidia rufa]